MKTIPYGSIVVAIMFFSLCSCETQVKKDIPSCETSSPLEDVRWLLKMKDSLEQNNQPSLIIMYAYRGENVFYVDPCYQCPDALTYVYNCAGEIICEFGGIDGRNTCPGFDTQASDSTLLFDNRINPCNSDDPLEDIQWLKEKKQELELSMGMAGSQIVRYRYMSELVFWIDECYQCPDAIISVYNCEGVVICEFGGIDGRCTCPDFDTEAADSTMLYDNVQH
jgi:hypothetical protein